MRCVRSMLSCVLLCAAFVAAPVRAAPDGNADGAWPAPVAGFVAPQPGEHPRLFFRKADLPALRKLATTPDGKMLVDRTIYLLDGATQLREGKRYTMFDAAAFGFLY